MLHLKVFTDGSVNTQSKVGYGAYLVVSDSNMSIDTLKGRVKTKRFAPTSSTKLELQTLLWALDEILVLADKRHISLTMYTDCQNIIGLPSRRAALEQEHYLSGKKKPLANAELYQAFYQVTSQLNFQLIKVSGHQPSSQKDETDKSLL